MKTLRRIVAVGLLIGSYHVGFAQSNGGSPSSAQLEKKANKEAYQAELKQKAAAADAAKEAKAGSTAASPAQKQEWKGQKHAGLNNAQTVKNSEKYSSDAEKKAAVGATASKSSGQCTTYQHKLQRRPLLLLCALPMPMWLQKGFLPITMMLASAHQNQTNNLKHRAR
jgi:hypothetical protein